MGWLLTPPLKEPYVCEAECKHTDCAEQRRLATSPCRICGLRIGENVKVYLGEHNDPAHATCRWAEQAARDEQRAAAARAFEAAHIAGDVAAMASAADALTAVRDADDAARMAGLDRAIQRIADHAEVDTE